MEYLSEEAVFWTPALDLAFFPLCSSLVIRGPSAVTVLLITEVEAGLLEGVPEAAELIRGLLLVPLV